MVHFDDDLKRVFPLAKVKPTPAFSDRNNFENAIIIFEKSAKF